MIFGVKDGISDGALLKIEETHEVIKKIRAEFSDPVSDISFTVLHLAKFQLSNKYYKLKHSR